MNVLVALTVGLVFWICAWTFGLKAFDAFLVTIALVLAVVTYNLFVAPIREQYRS
jgi:Mn2+/Fe2+ NRAMP family transporter